MTEETAKPRSVGRPRKNVDAKVLEVIRRTAGGESTRAICKELKLNRGTYWRRCNELRAAVNNPTSSPTNNPVNDEVN